jgi:hypothetical protein
VDSFSYTDDKAASLIQIQMRANALTFPKPWEPLDSNQAMAFIDELRAELSSEHPLYGIPLHVIAQSCSADDTLLQMEDGCVVSVHLTWSTKPEPPPFPIYQRYDSFKEWAQQVMLRE